MAPLVVVLVILMKIGYICPYSSTLGVIRFNTYSFLKDSPHIKKKKKALIIETGVGNKPAL